MVDIVTRPCTMRVVCRVKYFASKSGVMGYMCLLCLTRRFFKQKVVKVFKTSAWVIVGVVFCGPCCFTFW